MTEQQELRILQYNVQKSRDVVLASLFQDQWITEYDVLAIQEPWRNPFVATSYHPLKAHFQLTYLEADDTRVCFYINKRIHASTWNVSFITKDLIAVEIIHPVRHHKLSIINVYNEVGTSTRQHLRELISTLNTDHEIIVLGEFNLHHSLWSSRQDQVSRRTGTAQPLLAIIEDLQLQLLTVPGTKTHRWKDGESTIDLTFATEETASRTIYCQVDTSRDCDSDHLPIATAIAWEWQLATPPRKRLWAKTNQSVLRDTVKKRLLNESDDVEPRVEQGIDEQVRSIVTALQSGIDVSTPWSNPCPRSVSGFDEECKDICHEVQQLRRQWQRTRLEDDYEAYRVARNKKGRRIQKLLRNTHRQRVEEASSSESGLWKLVKWAKNRQTVTPTCTPTLRKPEGGLARHAEEKAETLRQSFFPPPRRADLSDIDGYEYPPPITCPEITETEIKRAVRKAAPNKTPGTDDIPNGILHQTLDIILPTLLKLFNTCLRQGYSTVLHTSEKASQWPFENRETMIIPGASHTDRSPYSTLWERRSRRSSPTD